MILMQSYPNKTYMINVILKKELNLKEELIK